MGSLPIGRVHLIERRFLSELVYATLIIIDGVSSHREPNNGELFIVPSSNRSRTTALQAVNPGSSPGGMTIAVCATKAL